MLQNKDKPILIPKQFGDNRAKQALFLTEVYGVSQDYAKEIVGNAPPLTKGIKT